MPAIHGWNWVVTWAGHQNGAATLTIAAALIAVIVWRQEVRRVRWAMRIDRFRLSLYGNVELLDLFDRIENQRPDPCLVLACSEQRAQLERLLRLLDGVARDVGESAPRRHELAVLANEFLIAFESASVQAYLARLDSDASHAHDQGRPFGAFRDLAEQLRGQSPR